MLFPARRGRTALWRSGGSCEQAASWQATKCKWTSGLSKGRCLCMLSDVPAVPGCKAMTKLAKGRPTSELVSCVSCTASRSSSNCKYSPLSSCCFTSSAKLSAEKIPATKGLLSAVEGTCNACCLPHAPACRCKESWCGAGLLHQIACCSPFARACEPSSWWRRSVPPVAFCAGFAFSG